jgi:hypothetical protein
MDNFLIGHWTLIDSSRMLDCDDVPFPMNSDLYVSKDGEYEIVGDGRYKYKCACEFDVASSELHLKFKDGSRSRLIVSLVEEDADYPVIRIDNGAGNFEVFQYIDVQERASSTPMTEG